MFRIQGSVNSAAGPAIAGCLIYICTQPADTTDFPPSPLASLFTDSTGATPLTNPVISDGQGNWFAYAATGTYTVVVSDPFERIPVTVFPDQQVVSPGGGSVTSIAFVGDNVLFSTSISGSPITSAGTINLASSLKNLNANTFIGGPTSGSPAPAVARALVAADLPSGVGTVTSVAATLSLSALLSGSVSGSPVTGSGTLGLTINFANQNANLFLAGPASGSAGAVTARAIVPADLPGLVSVAFSATPTFDASAGKSFSIALTGDVTSSTVSNPTPGEVITFIIAQDATGSRGFVWPSNFKGASAIGPEANSFSVQSFIWDGTNWRATGPGSWNPS